VTYKEFRGFVSQKLATGDFPAILKTGGGVPHPADGSQVAMGIGLKDSARSYGIGAGRGDPEQKGLAYSHNVLATGAAGVAGGAAAGAAVGSPFVTSTLLRSEPRSKAIAQAVKDYAILQNAGTRSVIDSLLNKNVSLNPEVTDIVNRRLKAGVGAGAIGFGLGALGKGLYNVAEYNLAKKLTNPERPVAKTAADMPPFLSQDRPEKVKEIYRALKREHPEYSAGKKARIANAMGKEAEVEYRGKKFPGYNQPVDSDRPEKKKMVLAKKGDKVKLIHFGQKGYKHNYSDAAKKNYLTRSAGIRGKDGSLTANDKFSANYWARRELWPKNEPADGSAKNRTSGKQLEKKAGRPILQYRGQVTDPRWWYLNKKGNPASKTWLKKQREEAVALGESVADARGDYGRPFGRTESHLHGAKGSEGIHFYGTLSDARNALKSAKRGNSTLKEASFKIASSDEDLGHGMELAGLGILAAPAAAHLGAKIPGVRSAAKPLSDYLHKNHSLEHAVELGGLGVLGVPAIKHFRDKRKKEKSS